MEIALAEPAGPPPMIATSHAEFKRQLTFTA
jgi:hypothetical protein